MTLLKKILLFACLLTFASNVDAQNYVGKKKDIQKILKNIENFSQYYMNGEADKLAAAYTSDGKIFPGRKDIIEGTSLLEKYWTVPKDVKITKHKVTPVEIKITKKVAYDFGYYEGETLLPDGKTSAWKGKYVIIWKKVGKDWKIYLDIWNSIDE